MKRVMKPIAIVAAFTCILTMLGTIGVPLQVHAGGLGLVIAYALAPMALYELHAMPVAGGMDAIFSVLKHQQPVVNGDVALFLVGQLTYYAIIYVFWRFFRQLKRGHHAHR